MPTPLQSKQHFAGSRFPAQSRQRERHFTDSTTAERRAWAATRWVHGRARQTCPQPAAVVSDQCGFTSEFGCFCPLQCSLRNGGGAEMADLTVNSDVLAGRSLAAYCWSCPCEASRAIADFLVGRSRAAILPVLADMRSIAASGIFGRTAVFDGLGSLRPSERMERKCSLRNCSEMEWSGCKLMSPASGAAEACRYLARGTSASVGSVTPGNCCDASVMAQRRAQPVTAR